MTRIVLASGNEGKLRELAALFDLVRGGRQHRRNLACAFEVIDAARLGAARIE